MSLYTVNIYLNSNDNYIGGKTRFYNTIDKFKYEISSEIEPFIGKSVIFNHEPMKYLHDGQILKKKYNNNDIQCIKYLLRTDVVYKRVRIIDSLLLKFSRINVMIIYLNTLFLVQDPLQISLYLFKTLCISLIMVFHDSKVILI